MTAPLTQALKRRGFPALNSTKETLTVAGPGTLTQRVYTPTAPKSVRNSKAKSVLIASGTHRFAAAGKGTLTLRLTAAGRRAIRPARSLKIEIVTQFTPPTGTPVIAIKRLSVKVPAAKRVRTATNRAS